MLESKLIKLLQLLNQEEMNRLYQYLHSPYWVDQEQHDLLRLFDLLWQYHPEFEATHLDKDRIYTRLFPDQPKVKNKLEKLMSALVKCTQHFIVVEQQAVETDEIRYGLMLARFYRQRQQDQWYTSNMKQLVKRQAACRQKDRRYYYEQFLIEQEKTDYQCLNNELKEDLNLPKTMQSLDQYYIVSQLEHACSLLAQSDFRNPISVSGSLDFINQLSPAIEQSVFVEEPMVLVYHKAYQLLAAKNSESYTQFKDVLEENAAQLPVAQLKDLQTLRRNYCVFEYNSGNKAYLEETYQLYSAHLAKGYLSHNGGLFPSTFRNITEIGLKMKAYDWVYRFLQDYRNKIIGTNSPDRVYCYNLANYYFSIRDFDKALQHLADNFEDIYYKLAARRLELKIYFESRSVLLEPKIDAFKMFVFRIPKTKIPALHREGNNNFIDLLRQINHTNTYRNPPRIDMLIDKISQERITVEKDWMIEKLEEMK